jgi:RecA-family ATPase
MVKAYGEKYGEWPHLIIVDNLMNVSALHDNEWTGMRDIMKACHHIARETDSAIFILHHTSEAEGEPTRPPSRRAIQGKVSQLPEMILLLQWNLSIKSFVLLVLRTGLLNIQRWVISGLL